MSLLAQQNHGQSAPNGGTTTMVASADKPRTNAAGYTDNELEEFKQLLLRKKKEANEIIDHNQKALIEMRDNLTEKSRFAEKDDEEEMAKENAAKTIGRQKIYVGHLDRALERIANKTYGICFVTKKAIPKAELLITPHRTRCVAAKEPRNN